jgi:thioredoxin reductase (NADPH)
MSVSGSPRLSESQLAKLAALGEERTASVGDVLYRVGDRTHPFIAIIEGEVAILDAAGDEIIRHGKSRFLGELSLLSGQIELVTAVVTEPLRYTAVEREALRSLLFEDAPLSDMLLSTFISRREALPRVEQLGIEVVGPRSSSTTMRVLEPDEFVLHLHRAVAVGVEDELLATVVAEVIAVVGEPAQVAQRIRLEQTNE